MRWRGLALCHAALATDCSDTGRCVTHASPHRQADCSAAAHRVAVCLAALASRLLRCCLLRGATGRQAPRPPRRLPGPSVVPKVALGADPVFSGERFLLPIGSAAQGLSARTSRFFSHPQDICCLSPVHGRFPPSSAQLRPQLPGIAGSLTSAPGSGPQPHRTWPSARRSGPPPRRTWYSARPHRHRWIYDGKNDGTAQLARRAS